MPRTPKRVKQWYVLRTAVGKETRVRQDVKRQAKIDGLEKQVGKIIMHRYPVKEFYRGEEKVLMRKAFPGYLICQLDYSPDVFHLVRDVRHVVGFLGGDSAPSPLSEAEVQRILAGTRKIDKENPPPAVYRLDFKVNHTVVVTGGPWKGMEGLVTDIDEERPGAEPKVTVAVEILGRKTELVVNCTVCKRS